MKALTSLGVLGVTFQVLINSFQASVLSTTSVNESKLQGLFLFHNQIALDISSQ
jgi:hypothetical protein